MAVPERTTWIGDRSDWPSDEENRRQLASRLFAKPKERKKFLNEARKLQKMVKQDQGKIEFSKLSYELNFAALFTQCYCIYLAAANDTEISKRYEIFDDQYPYIAERILRAHTDIQEGVIGMYGRALVGAALRRVTPAELQSMLSKPSRAITRLAQRPA